MCYSNVNLLSVNLVAYGTKAIGSIPSAKIRTETFPVIAFSWVLHCESLVPLNFSPVHDRTCFLESCLFISLTPETCTSEILLYFHVEQECKVNAEYGFSSMSHWLLDAFLCVCARVHAHTGSEAQSLVQSSKTPMNIDLCGEGSRHLRIHQVGRKAAAAEWSGRTPVLGVQWAERRTCSPIIQHLWSIAFL